MRPDRYVSLYRHPFLDPHDAIAIAGEARLLHRVALVRRGTFPPSLTGYALHPRRWDGLWEAMARYLDGEARLPPCADTMPAALPAFTRRCLEAISRVPYGASLNYAELARRAGNPNAARAAGQACARNPLPLLIPCHRVVPTSKGDPGAYVWGRHYKKALLALETSMK